MITDANSAAPRLYWLHTDHLGAPQKATDDTATLVWDTDRTPFGELTALTGSLNQPLHLPGQYADAETGLHQNWWRDYDPALGRYPQADPIWLAGGVNLYGYAYGNPVSYVDPDGRIVQFAAATAIAYAGFELGITLYDAYGFFNDLIDPCVPWSDVAISGSGLALGMVAPGGLYGSGGKAIKSATRTPHTPSAQDLSDAGRVPDRNGFTRAGRSAQKHSDRPGSAYQTDATTANGYNQSGQDILDDIITNPGSQVRRNERGGTDVEAPDGRVARFNRDGSFQGFREPE